MRLFEYQLWKGLHCNGKQFFKKENKGRKKKCGPDSFQPFKKKKET